MSEEIQSTSATRGDTYAFGDDGAGNEVGLPSTEIRKMRMSGLLEGAYAKIGHRSIIYHRSRLRQRINEAFATGGINAAAE
jgi:hypothetical protein